MNAITPITKQIALIKREFWEQKLLFLLVPLCCVAIVAVTFGISVTRAYINDYSPFDIIFGGSVRGTEETAAQALERFSLVSADTKEAIWERFYGGPVPLLFIVFWGSMIYYYLSTLYQARKDRSILFWNSMPVSSAQTIISKLISGLVITQAIFLVCYLAIQLTILAIFLVYGAFFDVDLWTTFVGPAKILPRFFWLALFGLVNIFWCLPAYAWLLFNSAWSRSAPLAWAAGPLLLLIIPEMLVHEELYVSVYVVEHFLPTWMFNMDGPPGVYAQRLQLVWSPELLLSILLGLGLVYAAIRFNRSEDI